MQHALLRLKKRLGESVALLNERREGAELVFAADFSEVYAYLHPQSAVESRGIFRGILEDVPAAACERLALGLLVDNPHRPALLLQPHILELGEYARRLAGRSLSLIARAHAAWANLSEGTRSRLERLGRGEALSETDVYQLLTVLRDDFASVCADVVAYVQLSPYPTVAANLRRLLTEDRLVLCGVGDISDPFVDVEVTPNDALERRLFEALVQPHGRDQRAASLIDAKALVMAKGLTEQLDRRRVVLVSRSHVLEAVVSRTCPFAADSFCSLETFFLMMLSADGTDLAWHERLEAEASTAIAAMKAIDEAPARHVESTEAVATVQASITGLINQRLGTGGVDSRWTTAPSAGPEMSLDTDLDRLELLREFVRFVSADVGFRAALADDSRRLWNRLSLAVDRLRQLSRDRAMKTCFLSYSSADSGAAGRIRVDLQEAGVACWFAPESLRVDQDFSQEIEDAIRLQECLIVMVSKSSVVSPWVRREIEAAWEIERAESRARIVVVQLDDELDRTRVSWAAHLRRTRQVADFRGWREPDAYARALRSLLKGLVSTTPPGT